MNNQEYSVCQIRPHHYYPNITQTTCDYNRSWYTRELTAAWYFLRSARPERSPTPCDRTWDKARSAISAEWHLYSRRWEWHGGSSPCPPPNHSWTQWRNLLRSHPRMCKDYSYTQTPISLWPCSSEDIAGCCKPDRISWRGLVNYSLCCPLNNQSSSQPNSLLNSRRSICAVAEAKTEMYK